MILSTAEAIKASWKSRTTESGEVQYWDPAAHLWRSLEASVQQADMRDRARARIGDEREWAAQSAYERRMGL